MARPCGGARASGAVQVGQPCKVGPQCTATTKQATEHAVRVLHIFLSVRVSRPTLYMRSTVPTSILAAANGHVPDGVEMCFMQCAASLAAHLVHSQHVAQIHDVQRLLQAVPQDVAHSHLVDALGAAWGRGPRGHAGRLVGTSTQLDSVAPAGGGCQ